MVANPSSSQSFTQPDGLTTNHAKPNGIKLTDEQVRRFICDGVVLLQSSLPPEVHQDIYDKLHWSSQHEFNMGNNVLPRVAELQQVLDDPVVHGGVQSVLGDDYIFHPHRFMHVAEPLDEAERNLSLVGDEHGPPMGEGSSANSAWHQDGQIPKGRTRWHLPRIAMILYFPQDTPMERGPTRVIPGTHMQPFVQKDDHAFAFVGDHIKAGTCFLIHFDIAHAALSNRTDSTRYMLKFIYLRRSHPAAPSWDGGEVAWKPPETRLGRYDHSRAWSHVWDWMRGAPRVDIPATADDIQKWMGSLNVVDQAARLEAIYGLAGVGADAIGPLMESLLGNAGQDRHFARPYHKNVAGAFVPIDDINDRRFSDHAFVPQDEAYALGAMGEVAVPALLELLNHDDTWMKLNAIYALGEVGPPAACAVPELAKLLDHELHQVARVSLDAMAFIGTNIRAALPAIRKLLTVDNPTWRETDPKRWSGQIQARFNALCALLNSDIPVDELDDLLVTCLDDESAYVHAMALEALTQGRDGEDRPGLRHALDYLMTHRWDHMLANGKRVF